VENAAIASAICLALAGAVLAQSTSTPPQITYNVPKVRSVIPTPTPVLTPLAPPPFNSEFAYANPRPWAFADFNGDGLLDIITAPFHSVSLPYLPIEIWLNKGDGTFYNGTSQVIDGPVPVTGGPNTMLIGDFNEDGRPDVMMIATGFDGAVVNHYPIQYQGFHQTLLLSQPNGKWTDATSQITPNTQAFNHQGGMGDVNGDGHLDVVVNRFGTDALLYWGGVTLLMGDGKGNFVEHTDGLPQDIAWGPWLGFRSSAPDLQNIGCAGLGDLDGDGRADLITGSYAAVAGGGTVSPRSIRFYQSQPDGTFVERSRSVIPPAIADIGYTTPNAQTEGDGLGCAQILVADLNGDGRPDIVVDWEGYSHSSIEILRNDGDFHFTDITPDAIGGYTMDFTDAKGGPNSPGHYVLLDLNGDGTLDLVSQIAADDLGSVLTHTAFLNDGHAHFTPWVPGGPNGPLTANDILPVTYFGFSCPTCAQLPMMFDTNGSGLASLVLVDPYSSQTTTTPYQATAVYVINVTPVGMAPSNPPLLTSVLPGSAPRGQQPLLVTIAGRFTHFSKNSAVTFSGTGVSAAAPASVTATSLTVPVTIAADAPLGVQGIRVTTGTETVTLAGSFTVSPGLPLGIITASPQSGNGATQTMTFTFTDPRGWQDLGVVNVLINNFIDGRNACYLAYSVPSSTLYLVNDAGIAQGPYAGSIAAGSSGTIQNSQCTVGLTSAAGSSDNLTLTLVITFEPAFAGDKILYLAAGDASQNNSGWVPSGVWQVPGAAQTTTTAVIGMAPASGAGFGPASYSFQFSDTHGFADLGVENILINTALDGRHGCYLAYAQPTNEMYLVNDTGTALLAGQSMGASGSIGNSQCAVSWGNNAVGTNGNSLGLTLNIGLSPGFGPNLIFYVAARDVNEANNTGWQASATWVAQ